MSKWINNLLRYNKDGNIGDCPMCGSANVTVQLHRHGKHCSITLTCSNCNSSDHFDGNVETNND